MNTVTLVQGTKFKIIYVFQGQEVVAEQSLDLAAKEGHWVILQVKFKRSSEVATATHFK